MSRRTRNLWTGGVAAGLFAVALVVAPAILRGYDAAPSKEPGELVMHEWGTFTSFAGSNGVNLDFRPLATNDLPKFIMGPFNQPGNPLAALLKDQFVARQRMETPVTYFYTDTPRRVNVRVDFPKGMLTEWYPVVKKFKSGVPNAVGEGKGPAFLDWGAVRLTPAEEFANVRVRDAKGKAAPASLPSVGKSEHYGHARETDSAVVETVDAKGGSHFEKFLFYRGLGNFELPIKLVAAGNDHFEVTNSGEDASGALLLVRIDNGQVRFTRMDPIAPGAAVEVELSKVESTVEELATATVNELTAAGLYQKEALAMVNTWRSSWFGENGTRLLYLAPDKVCEELLPLNIEPAPQERVRVLVGRLETLTPEDCQRLTVALAGKGASSEFIAWLACGKDCPAVAIAGNAPTKEAIDAELTLLGRFAEPAIQFVISQTTDAPTRKRLQAILATLRGDGC